jgi:hypothetical protein
LIELTARTKVTPKAHKDTPNSTARRKIEALLPFPKPLMREEGGEREKEKQKRP